jgi:hypothetical protein
LILVGALLLLNNLGLLPFDLGAAFWPLLLVLAGVWILVGSLGVRRELPAETAAVPLEGAGRAEVKMRFGAGTLEVSGAAAPENLFQGEFTGGLDRRVRRRGDRLDVEMRIPESGWMVFFTPWSWSRAFTWKVALNERIPIELDVESGASEMRLNLEPFQVKKVRLQTGASSSVITLPARAGHVQVSVESGAASVVLHVPAGVAGRIRARGGLSDIQVDANRFRHDGDRYESQDFETAENRVEIDVQTGVGSVKID